MHRLADRQIDRRAARRRRHAFQEQREPLKDIVALVMDRSESMNFRGRTETAQAAYDKIKAEIEADDTLELRQAETDPASRAIFEAFGQACRDYRAAR